jgi:hypothetical protein
VGRGRDVGSIVGVGVVLGEELPALESEALDLSLPPHPARQLDAADGTAIMAAEVFFTASPMVMRAERRHDEVRKSVGSSLKERSSNMTRTGDVPPVETSEGTVKQLGVIWGGHTAIPGASLGPHGAI